MKFLPTYVTTFGTRHANFSPCCGCASAEGNIHCVGMRVYPVFSPSASHQISEPQKKETVKNHSLCKP